MKRLNVIFLAIICSLCILISCELFGVADDIETYEDYDNEALIRLTRDIDAAKKKNDESYDHYTAFPPLSNRDKKDLSNSLRVLEPLRRSKRSQEIVIGKSKPADNSSEKERGKVLDTRTIYLNINEDIDENKRGNSDAGKNYSAVHSRRLIAGRDALIEDYPYVVSIQKEGAHWCAGAIITARVIITTANCVWRSESTTTMTVRVGSRLSDAGGHVVGIKKVVRHPDWNVRKDPDFDLALLLLNSTIRFSDGLHAAEIPNESMRPPFDDVWVTSWGTERPDGKYDVLSGLPLQVYHARLVDRSLCTNVTARFGVNVTENFFCVTQSGTKAPCTRDTGAPAVSDGVVWGVASWGLRKTCGTERSPAMFSYLASPRNYDFITHASADLMSEDRANPYVIN